MTALGVAPVPLLPIDPGDGRLEAIRRAPGAAGPAAAARELEVVFVTELLQAMRRTVPEDDFLPRSPSRDVYDGLFDRAVAEAMAASDPFGLVRAVDGAGLKIPANRADAASGASGPGTGRRGTR